MKNHYLSKTIATIFLVALCISCKDPYPYGYHEYVEVVNNSDSPIYIVGISAEYNPYNQTVLNNGLIRPVWYNYLFTGEIIITGIINWISLENYED